MEDAKKTLAQFLEEFRKNEKEIGRKLFEGLMEQRRGERRPDA